MVALKENYNKGYFEIRCKCNEDNGFWSAFWIQALGDPYDHYYSNGGIEAVEIDIFESMSNKSVLTGDDMVQTNIHCNGYDNIVDKSEFIRWVDSCTHANRIQQRKDGHFQHSCNTQTEKIFK